MKEKELREKMAGLYGGVPADTHAAFEHALTHHPEKEVRTVRISKVRFAAVLALLMTLLATGAYAIYRRYSVTDFMGNRSKAFLDHVITLDETYENDLFTMTVNDLVFDGSTFAVAMNIDRRCEDIAYYMRTKVTAICAGKEYMVDVEGMRGIDFLAGSMWPEYGGYYDDPMKAEQEGFGFDGVLWDWDMNPPPAGEPIDWTMTFTVFRPLWEIVVDNSVYNEPDFDAAIEACCLEAWQNKQIFMYGGDVNSYINYLYWNVLQQREDLPWEDMVAKTDAFELADVITFRFTTAFDDDVLKEEAIGQRYELGEYTVVIDNLEVSFQRVNATMHIEFDREMSSEEIKAAVPNRLSVTCRNAAGEVVWENDYVSMGTGFYMLGVPDCYYSMGFDFYHDAGDIASITIQGSQEDYATGERIPVEEFLFTIDIP